MNRDIVVTGLGAASALGLGVEATWEGLCAGRRGIGPLTKLDGDRFRIQHAGEAPLVPPESAPGVNDPAVRYLVFAVDEALRQAGLRGQTLRAAGLVAASNFGAMTTTEQLLASRPAAGLFHDEPVRLAMKALGMGGPAAALSLSCASGNVAIGYACDMLRSGRAQVVVAAGYDAISEVVWAGLCALRAMSATALLPFDARRDGTIFGEGAGALVLESALHANSRVAVPLARYLGCGTSSNAFHMTHPDTRGEGMARAMRSGIEDAEIKPEEVDYVNAHATGTKSNDALETAAIKSVFGAHSGKLVVNGLKSMLGHAMGAAGALEAVATVLTLRDGVVPPTIGLEAPDPECDLDYVPLRARRADVRTALNNSAGFGGCNAATVFRRVEAGL